MSYLDSLKELMEYALIIDSLPESDGAKFRLIERYRDKVSKRLLDQLPVLRAQAMEAFGKQVDKIMSGPSLFEGISRTDADIWSVPITFTLPTVQENQDE